MIDYEFVEGSRSNGWHVRVKLDGKTVGSIKIVTGGFAYFPRGSRRYTGELFRSVKDVQTSLESSNQTGDQNVKPERDPQ